MEQKLGHRRVQQRAYENCIGEDVVESLLTEPAVLSKPKYDMKYGRLTTPPPIPLSWTVSSQDKVLNGFKASRRTYHSQTG